PRLGARRVGPLRAIGAFAGPRGVWAFRTIVEIALGAIAEVLGRSLGERLAVAVARLVPEVLPEGWAIALVARWARLLAVGLGLEQRFGAVGIEHFARRPGIDRGLTAVQRRAARKAAAGTVLAERGIFRARLALAVGAVGEMEPLGAVGHRLALPGRLGAGLARAQRRIGGAARHADRRRLGQLAVEIDARFVREALAQLFAQHAGAHHLDAADRQVGQLERPEADADQAVDREAQRPEHILDLAVLAFAQGKDEPDVAALLALERGFDRAVLDAIDLEPVLERIELRLRNGAEGADAVFAQPAGGRQFEHALEAAVVGEQQQAFGVDVEAAD